MSKNEQQYNEIVCRIIGTHNILPGVYKKDIGSLEFLDCRSNFQTVILFRIGISKRCVSISTVIKISQFENCAYRIITRYQINYKKSKYRKTIARYAMVGKIWLIEMFQMIFQLSLYFCCVGPVFKNRIPFWW